MGSSLVAQRVKHLPAIQRLRFNPWVGKIPWRRKWQPTLLLLPGKSHGQRSLVGYSSWDCKEWGTTERLHFHFHCSWGSQGKNTEMACHSLLLWTMFCQNSTPWLVCLGWPYMALSDVQVGFRKGRGTRDQIANIHWIIKKAREFEKTSTSILLTVTKHLTVWITTNCGKFFKRWEYQTTWPASWEICIQVKKQQLELDMEHMTGSKFGKESIKAVYCHSAHLT